ncbi:MAG: sugar transferase [Saprospiraceae bacterium]|nr:sugar transferase [Saprospiraceae bacterium]
MTRFFDVVFSCVGLVLLAPVFGIVSLLVHFSSPGGVFYVQERIGRFGVPFRLYKFRSMRTGSDKKGLLTVGGRDPRITGIGYFLRRYKLDELPQLWNVLKGDMSLVGPRPEVEKYTRLYSDAQRRVLDLRPGITDPASIFYRNESEVLARAADPEAAYVREIMPHKIALSMPYVERPSLAAYFRCILLTVVMIFRN